MKKTFVRCKFVPIVLCALSLGLLLCSSAVAKGATAVEKASVGQYTLQCALTPAPALAPDIAAAFPCASNEVAITGQKQFADVALVLGSMKSNSLNKTAPATSSPPVVQDFECAIMPAFAASDHAVTHQPVMLTVRV